MAKWLLASTACAGVAALTLGTAGIADAAPAGSGDANAVLNELRSNGYRVVISKTGSGDLSRCFVTSVDQQSPVYSVQAARDTRNAPTTVPVLDHKIAYVALNCP